MIEIWKEIKDYPTYRVSNLGRVKATLGLDYSSLYQCCNNKRKSCNGFQWQYAKEGD